MYSLNDFGQRLKKARTNKNLTLQEVVDEYSIQFSEYGTISRGTLSKYENGKQEPTISTINRLSLILDVSVDYLLGSQENILKRTKLPENIFTIPPMDKVPLVGQIACGTPITAEENIEGYVKADMSLHADYALRCKGDSMVDAGIHDGDLVYIRQMDDVDDGQIAVVIVDGEATLKRVFRDGRKLVLQSENRLFRPLIYTENEAYSIRIAGKAVAVLSLVK